MIARPSYLRLTSESDLAVNVATGSDANSSSVSFPQTTSNLLLRMVIFVLM